MPESRHRIGKRNPDLIFPAGNFAHMHDAALLFFGGGPISQYEFLPGADFHGQRDQPAMRVYLDRGRIFFDGQAVLEMRSYQNGNPQEDALRTSAICRTNVFILGSTGHACV